MKVTIDCNDNNELEIIIKCKKIDDNIKQIVSLFEDKPYLIGKLNDRTYQIKIEDIYYLEMNGQQGNLDEVFKANGIKKVNTDVNDSNLNNNMNINNGTSDTNELVRN